MYVGAGLTVLSALLTFATGGQLADSLAETYPTATRAAVDGAVDRLQARVTVGTAVVASLWTWMAVKNGDGRRWARVVATAFGAIKILDVAACFAVAAGSVADDGGESARVGYTLPYLILAGATGGLALIILVQLYRTDSSRYYDESARWKAARTLRGD